MFHVSMIMLACLCPIHLFGEETNSKAEKIKAVKARGIIKRISPPKIVSMSLLTKSVEELVIFFRKKVFGMTLLECVSDLIEWYSDDESFRELRAELLDIGNLSQSC